MTHELEKYIQDLVNSHAGSKSMSTLLNSLQIISDRLDALEAASKPKPKQTSFMQHVHDHIKDRKDEVLSTIIIAAEMQEDVKRVGKAFSHLREKGLVEWVASNHWRVK